MVEDDDDGGESINFFFGAVDARPVVNALERVCWCWGGE